MSEVARANGWKGFVGLPRREPGGYTYDCDGMPTLFGCPEQITVTRPWSRTGTKKNGWAVMYGLEDDGTPDTDVVLTFCPKCAPAARAESMET